MAENGPEFFPFHIARTRTPSPVFPAGGRIYQLLLVRLSRRDSENDASVFIVGMGHYGLVKVPDLLAGSFALGTNEFLVVADKLLVVANQFLVAAKALISEVFILSNAVVNALNLNADALEFALHFIGQSAGGFSEFANAVYCGSGKADGRDNDGYQIRLWL